MRSVSGGRIHFSIALTWLLAAPCSLSQIGSDCSERQPCPDGNQECSLGYCRCVNGFILAFEKCLPERSFNESCAHDDQCVDFRMTCFAGRCSCGKFYNWDEYSRECLTRKNLTYMLKDMEEKYDTPGQLSTETDAIFTSLVWTGVAVMVAGVVLAFGCFFYGCCYQRLCRHNKRIDDGTVLRHGSSCPPTACSTVVPTGTVRSNAVAEGTAGDFIPGLYQTTRFDVI